MPPYSRDGVAIHLGDCLDVMKAMEPNSIDAVVTDPPYGIRFMGKAWDGKDIEARAADRMKYSTDPDKRAGIRGGHRSKAAEAGKYDRDLSANQAFQTWCDEWASEALRVAKPGAYLVVFGGTRTYHRLTCAIEDAGWEIRDCIMWVFGSGFPKSLDVSKAIDRQVGLPRMVSGRGQNVDRNALDMGRSTGKAKNGLKAEWTVTNAQSEQAKQWDGWGTALKPAYEPILIARKPLDGTVAENVLKWGTGAMNIDGCRVGWVGGVPKIGTPGWGGPSKKLSVVPGQEGDTVERTEPNNLGRWPANLIHDGSEEVLACFPDTKSGSIALHHRRTTTKTKNTYGERAAQAEQTFGDEGSAARFFYTAKASGADRGHEEWDALPLFDEPAGQFKNSHPTVKPLALMRYMLTLVSREGSVILDPFLGSGTTLVAAKQLGRVGIGIEAEAAYVEIANRRLANL